MPKKGSRILSMMNAPQPRDISGLAFLLLIRIADKVDEKGYAYATVGWYAGNMGISQRHVSALIWELQTHGYLWVYERVGYKSYYVVPALPKEKLPPGVTIYDKQTIDDLWTLRTPAIHKSTPKRTRAPKPPAPDPVDDAHNGHHDDYAEREAGLAQFIAATKGRKRK